MIEVTKLNQKKVILNCELIESIEAKPDTVVTLRNGKLYLVAEPPQEIVRLTMEYKRMVYGIGYLPDIVVPSGEGDEGQ